MAQNLTTFMTDLQKKCEWKKSLFKNFFDYLCNWPYLDKEFEPYVQKINQIDTNVTELERTVQLLDEYTKRLGIFEIKMNQTLVNKLPQHLLAFKSLIETQKKKKIRGKIQKNSDPKKGIPQISRNLQ